MGSFPYTSRACCYFFFFFFFLSFFLLFLSVASFYYKSHPGFIHLWGVSLTHPMLTLFLCGEFLLHIPWCLQFYAGIFSHTSRTGFIFMQGVSLTRIVLPSFLYLGSSRASVFFISLAAVIFIWGDSLTHPC